MWWWPESGRRLAWPSPRCTSAQGQDFRQVAPRFPDHAGQAERVELVGNFAAAAAAIVAAVDVEDILHGGGQGP